VILVLKKKSRIVVTPLVFISLASFLAPAYAQMMCTMDEMRDPLNHLPTCLTHHYDNGDIDNEGVYRSLLANAENAVSLNDKGKVDAAINVLNSLINELQAQNGKHVTESASNMLINHVQKAINQIN
jgi:hypothetical protein